jgi:hypothetical protein
MPTFHTLAAIVLAAAPFLTSCMDASSRGPVWTGPPFSAELIDPGQPGKPPTKVYLADGKIRLESEDPSSMGALVLDPAHNTTLLIDAQKRAYIDAGMFTSVVTVGVAPLMRFFRPAGTGDPCSGWNSTVSQYSTFVKHDKSNTPPHFTCRSLGSESVDGRPAAKWAFITDGEHADTGIVWIDDKLHIVSRSMDPSGQMEMRNVHEGAQPASLFTAPAGYKKVSVASIIGGMMKGSGDSSSTSHSP